MQKLNLDTSYITTGNSTGTPIDTLGIAFGFGDYNSCEEMNFDHIYESVDYAKKQWLDDECESFFRKSLTREQLLAYADDLPAYDVAVSEYRDTFNDVTEYEYDVHDAAQYALAVTLEKAHGDVCDDLYKLWLHGDYRDDGVLDTANKFFRDYNITIEDGKQGDVDVDISDETLKILVDEGELDDDATVDDVYTWIADTINNKAYSAYQREKAEREKRQAESAATREYKAKQAAAALERKRQALLDAANT